MLKNDFFKTNHRALLLMGFFISISLLSTWIDRMERNIYGVKAGVTVAGDPVGKLLPGELEQVLVHLAIKYQRVPVEPVLDKETGAIIPEKPGCIVDILKTLEKVRSAQVNQAVELEMIAVKSKHNAGELSEANQTLAYFRTGFRGSSGRYTNISLAASAINNTIVWPGETFSFNEIVGPRTVERGYMPAPVIILGSTDIDYGGGICQVSSTLFNAVSKAGLEIMERHGHSQAVHYVEAGRDAAVSYGGQDFKFKNNSDQVLIIKAGIYNGQVWAKILGRR